jgi:hypothetical protein
MATEITVVEQDITDAENRLEQYLTDNITDGDFKKGGALRDLAVKGLSAIYAFIRKEVENVRSRQSLLLAESLDDDDVDAAVDEILSNWLIRRKSGRQARGSLTVFLSELQDVTVPIDARFYKDAALMFVLDSTVPLVVGTDEMTPIVDVTGAVTAYTFTIPIIASDVGADYDIDTGPFSDFSRFSPYIMRVENETKFSGGTGTETTAAMLERSTTAISVRDLNSARSIDATLQEEFTTVDGVTVIGHGDEEMNRDLILEVATNTRIHGGGHVDVYLQSPITEGNTATSVVGASFADPRPGYYILRDDTVPSFTAASVLAGHVILINNGLGASEPDKYIVEEVGVSYLLVSRRTPFPLMLPTVEDTADDSLVGVGNVGSTDEIDGGSYTFTADDVGTWVRVLNSGVVNGNMDSNSNDGTWEILSVDTVNNYATLDHVGVEAFGNETALDFEIVSRVVSYSIGATAPTFADKVSSRISGMFTKLLSSEAMTSFPAHPIYRITDVSFALATSPYAVDGRVTFPNRVNTTPAYTENPEDLEYQVFCVNPAESQTGWQIMLINLGWGNGAGTYEQNEYFDGESLRVTYDSLSGYDAVWTFMLSDDRRILCGSVIPKGLNPVYITVDIPYELDETATTTLDTTAAAAALVEFINNFDARKNMDTSDIVAFLRTTYDVIGYIPPLTVTYELLAPDGRVITYQTTNKITVDDTKTIDPSTGLYPSSSLLTLTDPLEYGVSNATLRYLTVATLITFTEL